MFDRFGNGYDLWIDNCQQFCQQLAEAICSRDTRDDVTAFFNKRSVMKLPAAASFVAAPVYGATRALHHGLGEGEFKEEVGKALDQMEKFFLHPRVYAMRKRARLLP